MMSAAGLACVLILWDHPGLLTQSGFQLSFGAVTSVGGLGPWAAKSLELKKNWEKTVMAGAMVQAVTAPVILYHFYQYPRYGFFLNFVVVPLMAYVMLSGLAGLFLGVIWLPAGKMAAGGAHYILGFYSWLCGAFGRLPGANMTAGRPEIWQIALYAVLQAGVWLAAGRIWTRGTICGVWNRGKKIGTFAAGTAACFLVLWHLPVTGMETVFLDVGQGDGICIRTREAVILVDGGSSDKKNLGKDTLEPYLKSLGINTVDYAVVSHGDNDHINGLKYLLEKDTGIRVRNLILPWLGQGDEVYTSLASLAMDQGGSVHWMQAGERIGAGELSLTCLYHGDERRKEERNEHSLVLELTYGKTGILLTGDMSEEGERDMIEENCFNPDIARSVQVLKAAHHGSKYSSCEEFLRMLSPKWTVISCGVGNSYGHPHEETLERLKRVKSRILRTEDAGAIILHSDQKTLEYSTFIPVD